MNQLTEKHSEFMEDRNWIKAEQRLEKDTLIKGTDNTNMGSGQTFKNIQCH